MEVGGVISRSSCKLAWAEEVAGKTNENLDTIDSEITGLMCAGGPGETC